jgi:hypothetical protein
MFLDAVKAWVCDGYSADIRFVADAGVDDHSIWSAQIALNPLPPTQNYEFNIETDKIVVGQIQKNSLSRNELLKILSDAIDGKIESGSKELRLKSDRPYYFQSEMSMRDRWFYQMHMRVGGSVVPLPSHVELAAIDNQLRRSDPPFDGLRDAAVWLGMGELGSDSRSPGIDIRVNPPVDLIYERSRLTDDQLTLAFLAHPKFDVEHVGLAVRAAPGFSIETRRQVASEIKWGEATAEHREGIAKIQLKNADSALAILMIGPDPVRRQWITDSTKARNNRHLAVQHFDEDLKMIRRGVLESSDQNKFELGVASLLFLLGFSPSIQSETDSPDIIVTTPSGRLALVECTTRIADFSSKIGKLVDRRGALTKSLQASAHPAEIAAFLVCRLPRNQIVAQAEDLKRHKVILLSGEDLEASFDMVRHENNPDEILRTYEATLEIQQRNLFE